MKNLANCKPSEFLRQTSRIRKCVANWLDITGIMDIRREKPELITLKKGMTEKEREEAFLENKRRTDEQIRENIMRILEAIMDDHPDETLELLALLCFVEPENVDDYTITEYLESFTELIDNQTVLDFFTSLARLGNAST